MDRLRVWIYKGILCRVIEHFVEDSTKGATHAFSERAQALVFVVGIKVLAVDQSATKYLSQEEAAAAAELCAETLIAIAEKSAEWVSKHGVYEDSKGTA